MKLPLRHTNVQGVSVVIVTYNGTSKLKPTLEHLAKQQDLPCPIELLVVDNNSNDGTQALVISHWEQLGRPYPLRVLTESNPGTMYARQKGIEEADYRYILFCDDDNWLHSTYVETAYKLIYNNEQIAAVGGLGIITYEEEFKVPSWMCEQYERSFGTGSQGDQDGDISKTKGSLYTAGAIFDRFWLDRLYGLGFTTALKGRDGESLMAGEDTELTIALKLIGGQLHYSSQLHFQHFMPAARINWPYIRELWKSFGASNYILSSYKQAQTSHQDHYVKKIYLAFKHMMRLFLKSKTQQFSEGAVVILELEMAKGILNAMLFKQALYIKSKQTAIHLIEQGSKQSLKNV